MAYSKGKITADEAAFLTEQVKAGTRPKAKAMPLDRERMMGMDSRDPRSNPQQWPCYGQHVGTPGGNNHGAWSTCNQCGLRIQYIPRVGSNSQHTKLDSPAMTTRMLKETFKLTQGRTPTLALCKAVQAKIDAEEAMNAILETIKTTPMPSKPPSFIDPNKSSRSTSPSPSTWDLVTPPASPEKAFMGEMDQLLTSEEKAQIMNTLRARKAAREPVPESHDLAQAFEAELSQWKMRRCWNHFSQRSLLNWCWWLLLWHLLWQLAWWTSVWIIVMVFGKLLAHLTAGSVRHVNSKDFALDVSTWRKGMTSTRRKPGRTWNFSGEGPNQGRFGSVFHALSTANGPSSTMPLMRERNSWRPINGGSAVCFGVWMTSSRTPWRMTPCARSISNGLTHVEDGKNHLWSTWRSIWATTAGSGLIVVLMAATTGWRIQQVNTSSARNGSSRPLTSSSTRTSEQRLVQDLILTLGFKDKKLLVVPTIPGEWFKQLPVFGGNNWLLTGVFASWLWRRTSSLPMTYFMTVEIKALSETFVIVELYHPAETFFLKMTYFIQMLYLWCLENLWWRLRMVMFHLQKKFNGGNQKLLNTIEQLVTQPIAILLGWWKMLDNRNGKFKKFWSINALLVPQSNLEEQALVPYHLLRQRLCIGHGRQLLWTPLNGSSLEPRESSSFSLWWIWLPNFVWLTSSRSMTTWPWRPRMPRTSSLVFRRSGFPFYQSLTWWFWIAPRPSLLKSFGNSSSTSTSRCTSLLRKNPGQTVLWKLLSRTSRMLLQLSSWRIYLKLPRWLCFWQLQLWTAQSTQLDLAHSNGLKVSSILFEMKTIEPFNKFLLEWTFRIWFNYGNWLKRLPWRPRPRELFQSWPTPLFVNLSEPSIPWTWSRYGGNCNLRINTKEFEVDTRNLGRPQWIGPGRVIFQEVLPHQPEGDHRRHILWVLIGNRVMRCSVHSVRLCTEPERLQHDLTADEDPTSWKTLADILPKREFTDLVDQAPSAEELELPDLPAEPDDSTLIPIRRAHSKQTYGPQDFRRIHRSSPLGVRPDPHAPQHYDRPQPGGSAEPSAVDLASRAHQRGEYSPSIAPASPPAFDDDGDGLDRSLGINDYGPTTSQPKKPRLEYDLKWVEQLEQGAKEEAQHLDFMTVLEEQDECLLFNIDLEFESNRQLKNFERNPVSYLVKKINSSEVNLKRLTTDELDLFKRAKNKEVDSFIKNEAVRRCLDSKEVAEAYNSNRILKARWVLTWKNISPDEKEEALLDRQQNSNTTVNQQATKKAKARLVLLGYQHPSLLDRGFKTSAPVQSTLGRNLLYVLATTHQWELNGLDLATAFLQTQPTEADSRLWTTGVEELREALGVPHDSVLRILRNIYGSTTAPRGLWLDLHRTLTSLDGVAALGERCLWLWFSKTELDSTGQFPRLIGAMGGHVDDFHRVGDVNSAEWMATCEKIDKAYKWGTVKRRSYRHAGTDISTIDTPNGFKIVVDQDAYVESLPDLQISRERLRADGPLSDAEKGFCRTALGGLQWLAIQTQPQLCSRCNILLTEITTNGTMQHAREIQGMISEVRAEPQRLHFFRLPTVEHWNQLVFITMGDQAHANRPNGDSTGGIVSMIAGPESINGAVCPMMLTAWRSWKLRRKAIASNDAEIQAVLEGEDQNFRIRLLWTEIHGGGFLRGDPREDLVTATEKQVVQIKGIICTDSRGGYDAVEVHESPLLGLSNLRSALQAFQLRENLRRVGAELRWVASDYDLADAMTKKKSDSREALLKFMQCQLWSIAFDPQFRAAKRNKQAGLTAISKVNRALQQDHARALQNNDTVNAALISNLLAGEDSIHLYDDGPFWPSLDRLFLSNHQLKQLKNLFGLVQHHPLLRCHLVSASPRCVRLCLGSAGAPWMPYVATCGHSGHWWKRRDPCDPFLVGGVICLGHPFGQSPSNNHCSTRCRFLLKVGGFPSPIQGVDRPWLIWIWLIFFISIH